MLQCGLIGQGISYSRSQTIFETIFALDKIEGTFVVLDCQADGLASTLATCVTQGFTGLSVTIPHKERIIEYLDFCDATALSVRAVNSVAVRDGQTTGYNTDIQGFRDCIATLLPTPPRGEAMIYGVGGAARAVARGLVELSAIMKVSLVGRSPERLELTKRVLATACPHSSFAFALENSEEFRAIAGRKEIALLVNCTPVGGPNHAQEDSAFLRSVIPLANAYCDLNYNADNQYLQLAARSGTRAIDGFDMLIRQAVHSYRLWTGRNVDTATVLTEVSRKTLSSPHVKK